jgi:y4mF family transcriptional regulator
MKIDDISRIVRFHRKKAGLSQSELSRFAGVGKSAVFNLEKGKETIQLDTLYKILTVLNITVELQSSLMDEYNRHPDS